MNDLHRRISLLGFVSIMTAFPVAIAGPGEDGDPSFRPDHPYMALLLILFIVAGVSVLIYREWDEGSRRKAYNRLLRDVGALYARPRYRSNLRGAGDGLREAETRQHPLDEEEERKVTPDMEIARALTRMLKESGQQDSVAVPFAGSIQAPSDAHSFAPSGPRRHRRHRSGRSKHGRKHREDRDRDETHRSRDAKNRPRRERRVRLTDEHGDVTIELPDVPIEQRRKDSSEHSSSLAHGMEQPLP